MTLHNDITRCTGQRDTPDINFKWKCPMSDKCARYTEKPINPETASMMNAPEIKKGGCEYLLEVDE